MNNTMKILFQSNKPLKAKLYKIDKCQTVSFKDIL